MPLCHPPAALPPPRTNLSIGRGALRIEGLSGGAFLPCAQSRLHVKAAVRKGILAEKVKRAHLQNGREKPG